METGDFVPPFTDSLSSFRHGFHFWTKLCFKIHGEISLPYVNMINHNQQNYPPSPDQIRYPPPQQQSGHGSVS